MQPSITMWPKVLVLFALPLIYSMPLNGPVDLSYEFSNETLFYPGGVPFKFEKQMENHSKEGVWYASNTFSLAEHSGTHIDAPYHFNKEGLTIEKLPLENLIAKGVFVNATEETGENADYALPASKLKEWEEKNGPMPEKSVVLVAFGWAKRWPNKTAYFGPSDDNLHYPGLSKEAGDWLAQKPNVVGVGVDTCSLDVAINEKYDVHVALANKNIYMLENVDMRTPLPPKFELLVMPMKIANGTGAPVRLIAMP